MKKACVMDGGLEKLFKDYRVNQCTSIIQHQSVVVIKYISSYCSSSYSIYTIITIQPSLLRMEEIGATILKYQSLQVLWHSSVQIHPKSLYSA